jgi:enamine deaminase RidA (YjgF/YER057c/UK114 family)
MLERYYITPENSYKTGANNQILYTPVVVIKTPDLAHIYVAGRTARLPNGDLSGIGDMRAQIRLVCENTKTALESVGATLADVVRTVTYVTDVPEYYRACDERFKFFHHPLPTSSVIGVSRLGMEGMLVEIEVEAVIEPDRLRLPQS